MPSLSFNYSTLSVVSLQNIKAERTMRAEEMTVGIEICNLENLRIFNGYEVLKKEAKVFFFVVISFL